jgi:hypothetical protein
MSRRAASRLAWSLAGLSFAMFAASFALYVLARSVRVPDTGVTGDLLAFLPFLAFPIVGALISARRPRNPIGWICLADGLLWMLIFLSGEYIAYEVAESGSLPFPVMVGALTQWLWVPAVGMLGTYLFLLFPDGRLLSRRWRPLAWLSGATILSLSLTVALSPEPLGYLEGAPPNPLGVEGHSWVVVVDHTSLSLLLVCIVGSVASLVMRFRRSGGEVRRQIKWVALAASLVAMMYLSAMFSGLIFMPQTAGDGMPLWFALVTRTALLSFTGVPVAVGIAILKHRLYDIDVVINKALVYVALTVMLASVYLAGVATLQYLLRAFSGAESQLAVVASTLAIAALFGPLRRRIQNFIDRRFYRDKYDAARTLEAFAARLRSETDLETLNGDLVSVARETMQPAHVSLWMRGVASSREERNV